MTDKGGIPAEALIPDGSCRAGNPPSSLAARGVITPRVTRRPDGVEAGITTNKINLLNFDRAGLRQFFQGLGEKEFRADQLIQWVHQEGVTDVNTMSNFSKALRQRLSDLVHVELLEIGHENIASDGTHKWLMRLKEGNSIETVFIPEVRRGTLCISSQVGCALDCRFCSTGKQGFSRNLTVAEIIGQVWVAKQRLAAHHAGDRPVITNIVLMGMGEPLLNLDNVVKAMNIMMDDFAYGLSKHRVTLSTSGVVPAMLELRKLSSVALAVSLHAPNDALRSQLVPLNKKYPLKELMAVCKDYYKEQPKRVVTMEYVMLKDVNDHTGHAQELVKLLKGIPCKLNLIPFNPFPFTEYECSSYETIRRFQRITQENGIHTTIRKTRGDDIDAACGQLVGNFQDRTLRNKRWTQRHEMQKTGEKL